MATKLQKLLNELNSFYSNNNEDNPNVQKYLKTKASRLEDVSSWTGLNWKEQLIETYTYLKKSDQIRNKVTLLAEEISSEYQKVIKCKELELQMMSSELTNVKSSLEEEKSETQKLRKQHEKSMSEQRSLKDQLSQRLDYKEFQIRQLYDKINDYEEEIAELKSTEYQKILSNIQEQEVLSSFTQNLTKQLNLLRFKLKEEKSLKNQLSKHIKMLNQQIDNWHLKYERLSQHIERRKQIQSTNNQSLPMQLIKKETKSKQHEQTINLIEYNEDFSFKDSIDNDNNTTVNNNIASFLDLYSVNDYPYNHTQNSQSPGQYHLQRDILNLTDRDISTHSRQLTKHMLRSKKQYLADKENISVNTLQLNEFEQYYQPSNKICNFGPKNYQQFTSRCSIEKYAVSPKGFGTQERSSLLSKHKRIKSSFCGKIQQFNEYEQNHFIMNSEKFEESIYEHDKQHQNLANESSISEYDVQEIVINEELISSKKPNLQVHFQTQHNVNLNDISETKSISVPIKEQLISKVRDSGVSTNSVDLYYAFFSLTAQCVKLNSKNFNKVISVYFNLQQQYKNVLQKTIPINKWYNYIQDQIETALRYCQ